MTTASEDLRQAWQRQALDAPRISLAYLQHQLEELRHRTRVRGALKYVGDFCAVAFVLVACWRFIELRPLTTVAMVLWALGALVVNVRRHRRMSVSPPAEQMGTLDALQFYRQQLVRQRDARRRSWRWWLPPIIPGMVMTAVALALETSRTAAGIAGVVVWFVFGVALGIAGNERVARSIQGEIDALDSMSRHGSSADHQGSEPGR